jgi:hypothetical protein
MTIMKHLFTRQLYKICKIAYVAIGCIVLTTGAYAQTEVETARQYATATAATQQLTPADVSGMLVSSAYKSPTTGWHHVYFNQAVQGVEVYTRMMSVMLVDNQPTYLSHNFIADLTGYAGQSVSAPRPALSPLEALRQAVKGVGLPTGSVASVQSLTSSLLADGTITKQLFQAPDLSNEKVEVKLYWLPAEDANTKQRPAQKLSLVWNVKFLTKDGQTGWNIHIDAALGNVVRKTDDVVHCQFGHRHPAGPYQCKAQQRTQQQAEKPAYFGMDKGMFAPNQYNVFDYPLEAPTFGSRTVVTSPYTRFSPMRVASGGTTPALGPTNGWHSDGTTSYTDTRGNNVWAQEDADNNNTGGIRPASATLDFNYAYSLGLGTAAANQSAAITNLFYWNNLIHDVLWKFGFDEPSGNFQTNNLGFGGAGNDHVQADAQDGSGTDNANFFTPADGSSGRMQMFLWNIPSTYQADSDFDNAIIAHEYGHGWSIRLTGGPSVVNCLQNAEQGGEGWSDYLGLMLTTNWAGLTPTVASASIPRGIGTYVLGEPTSGAGIRPYRYSYDMANVNAPVTYAKVGDLSFSQPHGIGSIWCTMLWDMTWEIILQDNQIVSNIYDTPASTSAMRGNVAALKLVNEGLKLQPCSPSFVQARNAILQADQTYFNGRYRCAITRAFARRGLGRNASTGSSTNDRVVTEDFTPIDGPILSSALTASVCSSTPFAYTATSATAGVTFGWSRAAVAGISNPASSGNAATIGETLINTTSSPITVVYSYTLLPNSCIVPQALQVVVNPALIPVVASYSVCQNGTVPIGGGIVSATAVWATASVSITTGSGTYVRPSGDNATIYSAGSTVFFRSLTFVAPVSGAVTFGTTSAALSDNSADPYMALYQNAFSPSSPATNFVRGDDDSGPGLLSQFTQTLTQGTTYILVLSPYSGSVTGTIGVQTTTPVFPVTPNWFSAPSGGTLLATGTVFNPVGVSGSGIPNTATPGTTTFYLANPNVPACRLPTTFVVKNCDLTFDSATSGNWNVAGTWLCNCIPDGTKPVRILNTHTVTVPAAYSGQAKGVTFSGSGKLSIQSTGKVTMPN